MTYFLEIFVTGEWVRVSSSAVSEAEARRFVELNDPDVWEPIYRMVANV